MQEVKLGTKIKSIGISRSNVAANFNGRAVLLDKNPRVKQIAYDSAVRRVVQVTQEDCIRFKLSPRANYYLLIARLNTDMNANVIGSDFIVEYLQLSEGVYTEFIEILNEQPKFTSLLLKKVQRSPSDQYGYIKVTPSSYANFSDELKGKISAMRKNKTAINNLWEMVDADSSLPMEEYLKLREEYEKENPSEATGPVQNTPPVTKQIQSSSEFSDGGDFDSFEEEEDEAEETTYTEVVEETKPVQKKTKPVQKETPEAEESDFSSDDFSEFGDDDFGEF